MADTTIVNLIDQVRTILQDKVAPLRYTEEELINLVNTALLELRRIRPDAFIGSLRQSLATLTITDVLPVDEIFYPGMTYYVAGSAELRDDSFTQDNRAAILMNKAIAEWRTSTA